VIAALNRGDAPAGVEAFRHRRAAGARRTFSADYPGTLARAQALLQENAAIPPQRLLMPPSALLLPGWRARIGVISPTVLERIPLDFQRIAPDGAMLCGITTGMGGWAENQYGQALAQVKDSVRYLAARKVDFILHVASPIVVAQGPGYDRVLLAEFAEVANGIPCTTTIRAALDAFEALGAKRILAVTPFHERLNGQLRTFVEAEGYAFSRIVAVPSISTSSRTSRPTRCSAPPSPPRRRTRISTPSGSPPASCPRSRSCCRSKPA
jgi:hypothetical protein